MSTSDRKHLNGGGGVIGFAVAIVLLVCGAVATFHAVGTSSAENLDGGEEEVLDVNSILGDDEPFHVDYVLSYDLNGGELPEDGAFPSQVLAYDSEYVSEARVSDAVPSRIGREFLGWLTRVPDDCYLDPLVVEPGAELSDLKLDTFQNEEQWQGVEQTLRSFADEGDRIELVALWRDVETDEVDSAGIELHKVETLSSTTYKNLYIASYGAANEFAYLYPEGSSPPSGWVGRGSLGYIPTSSSLPTYQIKRNTHTKEYYWLTDVAEKDKLVARVWTYQGAPFYSDDAKGLCLTRYYKETGTSNGASNWFSTNKNPISGYGIYNGDVYLLAFYNIAFDGNGATSGSMSTMWSRQYGISYGLTANAFSRTGYTFGGWSGSNGGSYSNGQSVANLARSGTVTMYARWNAITYSIRYHANGATSGTDSTAACTYDACTSTPTNLSRTGYKLAGWNTKADGTGAAYASGSIKNVSSAPGMVDLYAQWEPITYRVAFAPNSDEVSGSQGDATVRYDAAWTVPECSYSRERYTFTGWNTVPDGSGETYQPGQSVSNLSSADGSTVTLYAQWDTFLEIEVEPNTDGHGSVTVSWPTYDYRDKNFKVYQSADGGATWNSVGVDYASVETVNCLHIYPANEASLQLKTWMESNGYGKGIIKVDALSIDTFNTSPDSYLKDANGNYKYDVIFFGTWDANDKKDLSTSSAAAVSQYIKAGRGVIAGHDCFFNWAGYPVHSNFNSISSEFAISVPASPTSGNPRKNTVVVEQQGLLTNYPWEIGTKGTVLTIPYSHASQATYGKIWLKFTEEAGDAAYAPGVNNFYLSTHNNTAVIQTGHSNGQATDDEQKILANLIFYMNQLLFEKAHLRDASAQDTTAPSVMSNGFSPDGKTFSVLAEDAGNTYSYYVESYSKDDTTSSGLLDTSNRKDVEVVTGVKKYYFCCDGSDSTVISNVKDASLSVSDVPDISWEETDKSARFIHVVAVDGAGNISDTLTVPLPISMPETGQDGAFWILLGAVLVGFSLAWQATSERCRSVRG